MQVRPKKTKKKILITITVILSLAVGGFVAYLYATWPNGSSTDSSSSQTETKRPADTDTNSDQTNGPTTNTPNTNSNSEEQTTVDGKTPIQYEGQTTETEPSTDNEQFRIPEGQ